MLITSTCYIADENRKLFPQAGQKKESPSYYLDLATDPVQIALIAHPVTALIARDYNNKSVSPIGMVNWK